MNVERNRRKAARLLKKLGQLDDALLKHAEGTELESIVVTAVENAHNPLRGDEKRPAPDSATVKFLLDVNHLLHKELGELQEAHETVLAELELSKAGIPTTRAKEALRNVAQLSYVEEERMRSRIVSSTPPSVLHFPENGGPTHE